MQNKVLAKVNGKEITRFDVDKFITSLGKDAAAQFNNEQGRKQILEELINQNLYLADAIDNDLEKTAAFQNEMARMKEVVLTQVNINSTMREVGIVEEELKKYFEENREKYQQPEQADTSHILVKNKKDAQDIYQKLVEKEIGFEEAAKKFSECPSKQNGGKLGMYARGKMVADYEKVAFALNPGEISKPTQTQFGYHVIKLNDKKATAAAEYADVKDQIHKDLIRDKQKQAYLTKLDQLKNNYNIERY